MFLTHFQQQTSPTVTLEQQSADAFASILNFIYTGYITLLPDDICDILIMTSYFYFLPIIKSCANFLHQQHVYPQIPLEDLFNLYYSIEQDPDLSQQIPKLRRYLISNFSFYSPKTTSFLHLASVEFL